MENDGVSRFNVELTELEEKIETLKMEASKEFPQNKAEQSPTQLTRFDLIKRNHNFSPDFQWKISGIKEKLKQESTFEIKSELFQWLKYPTRARATLKFKDDGIAYVSLRLEEEQKAGKTIDLKLIPHIYYVLRDQTKTNDPKHICTARSYSFPAKFNYSLDFRMYLSGKAKLTAPAYNVDDSIVIEIYVEPPTVVHLAHSYNGSIDGVIDHYQKRKRIDKELGVLSYESLYFYTGPKGYRVQMHLYLDRYKVLSAMIIFLPGEFDAELPLTFPHQTIITLINRRNPRRNIRKIWGNKLKKNKSYMFIVCSEKEMESVVENDAIYFNVTIRPIGKERHSFSTK